MIGAKTLLLSVIPFLIAAQPVASNVYSGAGVYQPTVDRWSRAIGNAPFESTTWIFGSPTNGSKDHFHRNKRRDTILLVPEASNHLEVTLIVWFHGLGGFSGGEFRKRIIPQIQHFVDRDRSVAIAIPEMPWSINTRTPRGRQGKVWQRPRDLEIFVEDMLDHLEVWSTIRHGSYLGEVRIVFAGFSAGGSALSSAAREGGLCRSKPTAVLWLDATYDHWLDKAWTACLKKCKTDIRLLVRKWDDPHRNAKEFMGNLSPSVIPNVSLQVLPRKTWTHGEVGNRGLIEANIFQSLDDQQ